MGGDERHQPLLFAGDPALICHHGLVERDEGASDLRPALHGQDAVRGKPKRGVEERGEVRDLSVSAQRQGLNEGHARNLSRNLRERR